VCAELVCRIRVAGRRLELRSLALRFGGRKLKDVSSPPAVRPNMTLALVITGKAQIGDWNMNTRTVIQIRVASRQTSTKTTR